MYHLMWASACTRAVKKKKKTLLAYLKCLTTLTPVSSFTSGTGLIPVEHGVENHQYFILIRSRIHVSWRTRECCALAAFWKAPIATQDLQELIWVPYTILSWLHGLEFEAAVETNCSASEYGFSWGYTAFVDKPGEKTLHLCSLGIVQLPRQQYFLD